MRQIGINRQLVPMKAHYFLWNAGTGPVMSYLSTYARQLGFSSVIVGLIYTILPICGMLAKPLFGAIADKFHCQKKIFLALQLLTAAAFLAIFYSPQVEVNRYVGFTCSSDQPTFNSYQGNAVDECTIAQLQNESTFDKCRMVCDMDSEVWNAVCEEWDGTQYCDPSNQTTLAFTASVPKSLIKYQNGTALFTVQNVSLANGISLSPQCSQNNISTSCGIECDDYNINDLIARPAIEDSEVHGLYQFWVFLLLMIAGWVSQAIVVSLGDVICFELLGDKPNRYGYQRLFGALGWGTMSALAGFLIDALSSDQSQKDYTSIFYLAAAFLVVDFMVSVKIEYIQTNRSSNIFRDIGRLLVDVRIIVYLLWCICVGACTGLIWQFLFWLIEDLAKAKGCHFTQWVKTIEGLVMAIQCLGGELPFFFLSGSILKKLGHIHTMSLVLLVLAVRLTLHSVITNPWWILPVEFTHGITSGLFYACMASYASIVAPLGTEATMQGMVGAMFEGFGVSLGCFICGLCFDIYGASLTFRFFGIASLIACVLHVAAQMLLKKKGD